MTDDNTERDDTDDRDLYPDDVNEWNDPVDYHRLVHEGREPTPHAGNELLLYLGTGITTGGVIAFVLMLIGAGLGSVPAWFVGLPMIAVIIGFAIVGYATDFEELERQKQEDAAGEQAEGGDDD